MVEIIKLTKSNETSAINKTAAAVLSGRIILYPTDTVYGIGCDATSEQAVTRIYEIKKRKEAKPLSVAFADFAMLSRYCEVNPKQEEILKKYLPGPYTFILKIKFKGKKKARRKIAVTNTENIGVRIPDFPFITEVCKKAGVPIVTTSANISGEKEAFRLDKVNKSVLVSCDLAIDGGATKYKQPSTVVDLISNKVLRTGAGKINSP